MEKSLSKIIDLIGLSLLNRKKGKESHFNVTLTEAPIADQTTLETFYPEPFLPNLSLNQNKQERNLKIWRYHYHSQISLPDAQTNICTGLFFENQSSITPEHVIFVHGWHMKDFKKFENIFLDSFMRLGYHIYFFTLPYHHERASSQSLFNGELMISSDINRTLLAVKQAVTDLRALIHWIKKNRAGQIVLIGVSLGGFVTNLTSVLENQIDYLVSIMYTNSLADTVWKTRSGKYIRQDLEHNGLTYNQLKRYWAITDPSLFQPKISKEKILLVSGKYDQYVFGADTDRLWQSWGEPKRTMYPSGHAGIIFYRKQILKDVTAFIKNWIK